MDEIPMPAVLDPHRPRLEGELDADTRLQQARDLDTALEKAADYGQYLWRQLRGMRQYLLEMLPAPDADDAALRTLSAPRGASDDEGWKAWQLAYEMVTSTLAGPHGDDGFARREAALTAQDRRGPREHSTQTADLVDLATERRVRAEEQTSTGVMATGHDDASEPTAPRGQESPASPVATQPPRLRAAVMGGVAVGVTVGVGIGTWLGDRRRRS